jgi:hypothetical protein
VNAFPSVDELEVELSTGQGVAVIVEGNSYEDDPSFYRHWFGARAREVSFFPQNGWAQLMAAVAELRQRSLGIPVYGIIDRDFCEDHELDSNFAALGILRTPRYTLENYLLDPQCWLAVFQLIFRRNPAAAQGWNDAAQVATRIAEAYQACFGVAAHNWVIKTITPKYEAQQNFKSRDYFKYFQACSDAEATASALQAWGQQLGASEDLKALFEQRLQSLQSLSPEFHANHFSGKYVLDCLREQFPLPLTKKQFPLGHYLDLYLDRCLTPPSDLVSLIDRIVAHAQN